MPRYFFHICNGTGFTEDEEGQELADEAAARSLAVKSARDVMTSDIRSGELDLSSFIEVEDENGTLCFSISFADAVNITAKHVGEQPHPRRR